MKSLRPKLTYANVVATLALFLALGGASAFAASKLARNSVGTRQLKNEAVSGAKLKNGAVTGAKVNLATLGTVPKASVAGFAEDARSASTAANARFADSARTATSAATAANATTAANASSLGGAPASSYAKAQLEPVRYVGQPGQPAFQSNCYNLEPGFEPVGFYKDNSGIVHLTGVASGCFEASPGAGAVVFTLPAGFRPKNKTLFNGYQPTAPNGEIRIDPNGAIVVFSSALVGLNGDSFRAE